MNKDRTIVAGHWRVTIDDDRQPAISFRRSSAAAHRRRVAIDRADAQSAAQLSTSACLPPTRRTASGNGPRLRARVTLRQGHLETGRAQGRPRRRQHGGSRRRRAVRRGTVRGVAAAAPGTCRGAGGRGLCGVRRRRRGQQACFGVLHRIPRYVSKTAIFAGREGHSPEPKLPGPALIPTACSDHFRRMRACGNPKESEMTTRS
jgi:hypothetical protein